MSRLFIAALLLVVCIVDAHPSIQGMGDTDNTIQMQVFTAFTPSAASITSQGACPGKGPSKYKKKKKP
jgi:hypothetical protein